MLFVRFGSICLLVTVRFDSHLYTEGSQSPVSLQLLTTGDRVLSAGSTADAVVLAFAAVRYHIVR